MTFIQIQKAECPLGQMTQFLQQIMAWNIKGRGNLCVISAKYSTWILFESGFKNSILK